MARPRFIKSIASVATLATLLQIVGSIGTPNSAFLPAAVAGSTNQSKLSFQYVPPKRGVPRTTQGTGSRGCSKTSPAALTLITPNDHTAHTVSSHPAFFWQVSEVPSEPVEFALVEAGVAQPVFVKQLQVQKAGIVRLEMPKSIPALVPGKEYRWSVSLICNANRRSSDVFAQGWIKRVASNRDLDQQLVSVMKDSSISSAEQHCKRASTYANAGLWHDAVDVLLAAQADFPSDLSTREGLSALLDQVGLAQVVR